MQLPRGTFREIRKKAPLGNLFSELEQTRFTGTCSIVAGPATGTFVFQSGKCILAKFRGETGDAGLDVMQQYLAEAVDVIISTLDEAQIKLSIEFNPTCRTRHLSVPADPGKPARTNTIITKPRPTTAPRTSGVLPPRRPDIPRHPSPGEMPRPEPAQPAVPRPVSSVKPPAVADAGTPDRPVTEDDDFESDIAALDSMDLDMVTNRIRRDCKILVRDLELDHLIER